MSEKEHILVTGGAGYIGSLLTAELLRSGFLVTGVDNLLYGGESILGFLAHPNFHFYKGNVNEPGTIRSAIGRDWPKPQAIVHLAGIVGFPACQAVGKQAAWRYNVEAVKRAFEPNSTCSSMPSPSRHRSFSGCRPSTGFRLGRASTWS